MGTVVAPVAERRELGIATDHELVAAVRQGEDRAFERLYERYHRRIAAYVYGMVNDYGRAEDITQEVFISALRRMRETERPIAFKPWIYEIAKNACIDQFRRSRRAEEISFDADESMGGVETARLSMTGGGPDAAVDAKQQLDHLCGAFGGLSETHHQILVLRELEGLSYREIGERMGLSRPSVESTLFRARRRLTEEYDELVSGQRCHRIQTIILTAGDGSLGARDQRRLQRHVAHCQPCRREARLAGLEQNVLTRSGADIMAAKVAAFLPFPFLFRSRKAAEASSAPAGDTSHVVAQFAAVAEPMAAGWSKAAAAAATVIVAGLGAGAATQIGGGSAKPMVSEHAASVASGGDRVESTRADSRSHPAASNSGKSGSGTSTKAGAGSGGSGGGDVSITEGAAPPDASQGAPAGEGGLPGAPGVPRVVDENGEPAPPSPENEPPVRTPDDPLQAAEDLAYGVDAKAGEAVSAVGNALGE